MKKIALFFILILVAILIFLNTPTHAYAQGYITCSYVGTQCFYFLNSCSPSYMPPPGTQHGCSAYDSDRDACNTVHIPCIQSLTPTPTSGPPPCGSGGQPCCGSIPPLYCSWPYVPSNNQDALGCTCLQPTGTPPPRPSLPQISPSAGRIQPTPCQTSSGANGIQTALGCIPTQNTNQFVGWLLQVAIGVGGGIAFLLMIFAGIKILTSSGDPQQLQAGKELLTSAITGLIFIIFSIFLLRLIGVTIFQIPGL